jgi:ParB family chromosome partitioning protein
VRVIEADDRRVAELALVENLQREDLNPIEEALGYKSLIEEYGLTQEEASKSVGKSRPAIANAMRLLSLSSEVLPLVEDGSLSAGHARALLPINDAAEQLKAARAVIDGGLSVRKTEQLAAKTVKRLSEEPVQETQTDALMVDYIAETEDYLSRSLSRKVGIEQKRKGGRIVLEFYNSDDREALIANLARMGKTWEEILN